MINLNRERGERETVGGGHSIVCYMGRGNSKAHYIVGTTHSTVSTERHNAWLALHNTAHYVVGTAHAHSGNCTLHGGHCT